MSRLLPAPPYTWKQPDLGTFWKCEVVGDGAPCNPETHRTSSVREAGEDGGVLPGLHPLRVPSDPFRRRWKQRDTSVYMAPRVTRHHG